MSGEAAAEILGVSLATLSRMVKRGDLFPRGYNPVKKRQKLEFDRAALEAFKADRLRQAQEGRRGQ